MNPRFGCPQLQYLHPWPQPFSVVEVAREASSDSSKQTTSNHLLCDVHQTMVSPILVRHHSMNLWDIVSLYAACLSGADLRCRFKDGARWSLLFDALLVQCWFYGNWPSWLCIYMSICIRKNKSQQSAIPSCEINCYETWIKTMANGSEWFFEHNYAQFYHGFTWSIIGCQGRVRLRPWTVVVAGWSSQPFSGIQFWTIWTELPNDRSPLISQRFLPHVEVV